MIACQSDVVSSGLNRLLDAQTDIAVVGYARDTAAVDRLVSNLSPDVLVVELSVVAPGRSRDSEQIIRAWASTKVIIFSLRRGQEYVDHCLGAGARGYVLAELLGSEIVDAVRAVYSGDLYLSSRLALAATATSR